MTLYTVTFVAQIRNMKIRDKGQFILNWKTPEEDLVPALQLPLFGLQQRYTTLACPIVSIFISKHTTHKLANKNRPGLGQTELFPPKKLRIASSPLLVMMLLSSYLLGHSISAERLE